MSLIQLVSMKKKIKLHRPIKFRAKTFEDRFYSDLSSARWLYGHLCISENGLMVIQEENGFETVVQSDTVGQFTGLYDKDDRAIYEGDIIHADCFPWNTNYVVKWDVLGARFVLVSTKTGGYLTPHDFYFNKVLIVGNIIDNPELLNKE